MKVVAAIIVLVGGLGATVWWYVARWNDSPLNVGRGPEQTVVLSPGESFIAFSARLEARDLMSHAELWTRLAQVRGLAKQVKAGEYAIVPGDTPESLLQRLLAGDVVTYEISLIEGWTAMQAVVALAEDNDLENELLGVGPETLLGALGLPDGHGEGLFFPDTYRFVAGDSDGDILRRAYTMMQTVLQSEWENRDPALPYASPYEALIVASLIEKETGQDADRVHISQVFRSRLEIGMRLQTDPSVIYGLGSQFDGNLTRRHLREDTPHNTYVHYGLPPTPIALPGKSSIAAALHPGKQGYLYFVARGDGSSEFSKSLAEHNAAVRNYQLR